MTKFNPENKDVITYAEALQPAMNITDQADADQYFKDYVEYQSKYSTEASTKSPEEICKINLAYYAGYYSNETRERVERLFKCKHPYFGSIAEKGAPTSKEAFEMGMKLGEKHKAENKKIE